MIGGLDIMVVEPGTEIESDGNKLTVDEKNAVRRGLTVFMTQRQYDALKAHPEVRTERK